MLFNLFGEGRGEGLEDLVGKDGLCCVLCACAITKGLVVDAEDIFKAGIFVVEEGGCDGPSGGVVVFALFIIKAFAGGGHEVFKAVNGVHVGEGEGVAGAVSIFLWFGVFP